LPASEWQGGRYQADVAGRPATVLEAEAGRDAQAMARFILEELPSAPIVVSIAGYEQNPVPGTRIEVALNGFTLWQDESWFARTGGDEWVPIELEIGPEFFVDGENVLVIRYLVPADAGRVPSARGDAFLALDGVGFAVAPNPAAADEIVPVEEPAAGGGGVVPTIAPTDRG
jgi:hypothetical protein